MAAMDDWQDVENVKETTHNEGDEAPHAVEELLKTSLSKSKQKLTGWFLPQMTNYHDGVVISDGRRHFSQPWKED